MSRLITIDAEKLLDLPLKKPEFLVDGLLPRGLTVLAGASKSGKSWLVLLLALCLSKGVPFWDMPTHRCGVLYISLEDTLSRLQSRVYKLTDDADPALRFCVSCEKIGAGLEEELNYDLQEHPDTGLVIIDTLQLIRDNEKDAKTGMYAADYDTIPYNPADRVERPKAQKHVSTYYTAEEMEQFLELSKDHKLALLFQMTAFYGLRRSEVIGLKWDNIDFDSNIFTIRHVVTQTDVEGKSTLIQADRAKNKSSVRSMPLVGGIRERLENLKAQQEKNREICGNCYNPDFLGYVFVDEMGNLYKPDMVSDSFQKLLKKHGLRKIRFHDIRHSCASLLLKNGVNLKLIQEWLGHSDISTTMNIYAHLDTTAKDVSAAAMSQALSLPEYNGGYGWQRLE